jgi:ribonuclease P protein component
MAQARPSAEAARFAAALSVHPVVRTEHFMLHHHEGLKLSTAQGQVDQAVVDEPSWPVPAGWLGVVVPKRHAKRAVTRNLIRRHIRAAQARRNPLRPGLWVVRLRKPYEAAQFRSAASAALAETLRHELDTLFDRIERLAPARRAAPAGNAGDAAPRRT